MSKETRRNSEYRKVWVKAYGTIPKDDKGRSYEIHHINGDHSDNRLENLKLVTIEEHYAIHWSKEDYAACLLIARRMRLTPIELSKVCAEAASKNARAQVANGTHNFMGKCAGSQPKAVKCSNGKIYTSIWAAAIALNLPQPNISKAAAGHRHSAGGFTFTYI